MSERTNQRPRRDARAAFWRACAAQRPRHMLVVPAVQPSFPSFPTHHKANHEGGRRMLDVYAQEESFQGERASVHKHRLGGNEDPTKLYEQGPRTWPSLALRTESDQVLEGSGIIGWCVARRKTSPKLLLTHWRVDAAGSNTCGSSPSTEPRI